MNISNPYLYKQLLIVIEDFWKDDLTSSQRKILKLILDYTINLGKESGTIAKCQLGEFRTRPCFQNKASLSTIQRCIRRLRQMNLITIIETRDENGDSGVNIYKVNVDVLMSRANYKKKTYHKPQVQQPSQETLNYGKPALNLPLNSARGGTVMMNTHHISFGYKSNDSISIYRNKDSQPKPTNPVNVRTSLPSHKIKENLPRKEGEKPRIDVKAFKSPKKTPEEHQATLAWLTSLNLNTEQTTQSYWAYEYDIETLKHVYQKMTKRIALGFSVRNPGAYMRTILTKSGDLPNNHTVSVKKMVERIKNEAPFPDIEIRDTYCFHPDLPGEDIPFRFTHEEFCIRLSSLKRKIDNRQSCYALE